jgi:hypothetical protein
MHKSWMVGPRPTMTLGIAQIRDRRIGLTRKSWMVGPALARLTMALGE